MTYSKKEREQYGIALCTRAVSDATALCWEELSHFKGKHKIQDTSEAIRFCRELDGMGPMHCVRNAHIVLGISPALSLETCNNALMRADPDTMKDCLTQLKPHVYSSSARGSMAARDHGRKGILDMDAIDFCAAAPSEISAACFVHSADMKLAASDRLKLCYGAESQAGPAECFHKLLPKISSSAAHDASDKDMASKSIIRERITLGLELCAMAIHDGPAMCFNEGLRMTGGGIIPGDSIVNAKSSQMSRGTSVGDATSFSDTDYTLLQLCQGSTGIGPVECFRKSQSVFRPVDLSSDSSIAWYTSIYGSADHSSPKGRGLGLEMRVHLCHHAPSSAPAECGLRAPQWLAASERVHLCSGASHETVPIKCLQSIEGPSKNFHKVS